jgi:hypothetical protein
MRNVIGNNRRENGVKREYIPLEVLSTIEREGGTEWGREGRSEARREWRKSEGGMGKRGKREGEAERDVWEAIKGDRGKERDLVCEGLQPE